MVATAMAVKRSDLTRVSSPNLMDSGSISFTKTVVIQSANGIVTVNGIAIHSSEVYANRWIVVLAVAHTIDELKHSSAKGPISKGRETKREWGDVKTERGRDKEGMGKRCGRARSKRKQHVAAPNNAESEVETEVESPDDEKKTKSEDFQSQLNPAPRAEDLCFQNPEISSGMRSLDSKSNKGEPMFPSNGSSKPERSLGQISFYDSMLSSPRIDHLIGKMEASGSYNPYLQEDDYNMTS
ncbi:WUSCHEL-related homeobox 13 [Camellia lanceoleosa]|uniref:WUSCHEL-related homeobox 13 n=1 Tax=Camellia lanceoleosa TaxID=1840588 RepID=A0ACC0IJZ1_9ERIC|nr:WUSCHEL-related homeobox 13 [Camellia lanceoleosa]